MAEKAAGPARPPADDDGANELKIMAPEQRAVVFDRVVEMREPTFLEAIELEPQLVPVIEEISSAIDAQGTVEYGAFARMVHRHRDVLVTMMALCGGVEPEWVSKLSDADGQRFSALFWAVNRHFFGRRIRTLRALRGAASGSAGPTSRPH